jgi:hypothetical protein
VNQEQRFQSIIERTKAHMLLEPVDIDPDLAEPKSRLKILKARHYNWRADRFCKIFGMRFSVKLPPMEQLNTIFYPQTDLDTPIFIFFCLVTKRKLIAHLNINCPFEDAEYRARHVDPLVAILDQYPPFDCKDRYPEWMKKYRNPSTIYGMFSQERLDDLTDCAFGYLDAYLQQATSAEKLGDPDRLERIRRFHEQFKEDIRTQDKAQGMIAKMIGADKARRIFYEVTT